MIYEWVIQGSEERENILQFKSQPEESLFIMIYEHESDWGVISMSYLCRLDNYGSRARRGWLPTWSIMFLWLINSLVDRCLDKIHKYYFRNLKFIRKSPHTIKSMSVKFMGGEQWQCDFMTGFFLRSCWWGVVSFNRTGSVDDQWSRSDLYECQFFFSVYSHVPWGKGRIVWYFGVSGWDLNWNIFPAPSSWFEREIYPNLKSQPEGLHSW